MHITIGFCEVALVTSLFYFPQSWAIGVGLLSLAVAGTLTKYLLKINEQQERKKELSEANKALKQSLDFIYGVKKDKEETKKSSEPKPTLVFRRPEDDDDTFH